MLESVGWLGTLGGRTVGCDWHKDLQGWGFTTTDSSDVSSPAWVLTDVDTVSSEGASVCLSSQESGTSKYLSPMNSLLPASNGEPEGTFEFSWDILQRAIYAVVALGEKLALLLIRSFTKSKGRIGWSQFLYCMLRILG